MMPRYDHDLEMKRQEFNSWAEHQRLVEEAQPEAVERWSFRDAMSRAIEVLAGQFAPPQQQQQQAPKRPAPVPEPTRSKLATDSGTFRIR